jgi:membrane protease YdiL (CAAX protease family)
MISCLIVYFWSIRSQFKNFLEDEEEIVAKEIVLSRTLLIISIYFLPSIIWFLVLTFWGSFEDKSKNWITLIYPLTMVIGSLIPFSDNLSGLFWKYYLYELIRDLLILILLIYSYKKSLSELFIDKEKQVWIFFGLFLIPFLYFAMVKLIGQNFNEQIKTSLAFIWMPFVFGIPSYVVEELYFRGYGINIMLKNGFGRWVAIIPSVIIFSLYHISQPDLIIWQLVPTIILSFIFSLILIRKRNIMYPIVFHFLWNMFLSFMYSSSI